MKTSFDSGISQVTIGVGSMIKGMLGAQAVIAGIQKLTGAIRQGVNTAIDLKRQTVSSLPYWVRPKER